MRIQRVHLYNFRNYQNEIFDLKDGLNLIVGNNAQGKTNFIESVYISSIGKSFRSNKYDDLLGNYDIKSQVGILFFNQRNIEFKFLLENNSKKYSVNNSFIKFRSELFGVFPMAIFFPDYLNMIKDTPSYRRKFIDREISLYSKKYLNSLINYNKALSQKNYILKQEKVDRYVIEVYDIQLAKYGVEIFNYRKEFIEFLSKDAFKIHLEFTSGKENLKLEYKTSFDKFSNEETYLETLKDNYERDLKKGYCNTGVHVDDIEFYINDREVKKFGSQGQVRIASLSVYFALIDYIETKTNIKPIVLLDDAFSELDLLRQNKVIEYTLKYQTIITTTTIEFIENRYLENANIIEIIAGRARRE